MTTGTIQAIHIIATAGASPSAVPSARALAGRGLEGDRYCAAAGTFSKTKGEGKHLTLIEAEALEALERDYKIHVNGCESRRNLLTRGIALNHLVGRVFKVGNVTAKGVRLCEPCGHLEKLTRPGVREGLIHRGGLRADILSDGEIAVGDAITPA